MALRRSHPRASRHARTQAFIDSSSCPYRSRVSRSQETVYLTVRLFSPAPSVIGVSVEHFRGRPKRGPTFELVSDPAAKPKVVDETDFCQPDEWRLCASRRARLAPRRAAGGKRITARARGAAATPRTPRAAGPICSSGSISEFRDLVYGLGERFTAFAPTARASKSGIATRHDTEQLTRTSRSSSPAAGACWSIRTSPRVRDRLRIRLEGGVFRRRPVAQIPDHRRPRHPKQVLTATRG